MAIGTHAIVYFDWRDFSFIIRLKYDNMIKVKLNTVRRAWCHATKWKNVGQAFFHYIIKSTPWFKVSFVSSSAEVLLRFHRENPHSVIDNTWRNARA